MNKNKNFQKSETFPEFKRNGQRCHIFLVEINNVNFLISLKMYQIQLNIGAFPS